MVALDAYSSTNALNQTLMTTVKALFKNREITYIRTAESALDFVRSNDLNKFIDNSETYQNSQLRERRETEHKKKKQLTKTPKR